MSTAYTYETTVGDKCCYFGQVDKVIPQPGDGLLILGLCECFQVVTAKVKAGEDIECGQALYMDVATEELTKTPIANAFYGIAKEPVMGGAEPCPVTVYIKGGFDEDQIVIDGGAVDGAFRLAARGLGIILKKRV